MLYRKIGITRIAIVCFAIWSFKSVEVAAKNADWTEAKKTGAATAGAWKEWCENWRHQGNAPVQMTLTPGKDESELNFSWYSTEDDLESNIRVADNEQFEGAIYLRVITKKATKGFNYNRAIVANLQANKTYYYSYMVAGRWTKAYEFQTKDSSNFQFVFVGDVQIGSSYDNIPEGEEEEQGQERAVCNDSFNWNATLQAAYKRAKNLSFIVTAGDQIQSGNFKNSEATYKTFRENEIEYAGYLLPELLRKIPVATTIGNHDCLSGNYSYHFNNPNSKMGYGATYAGEDYYFSYGDTIFLMLNTNNENADEHEAFIEKALSSNKDARWRIVAMHQDIFGSGEHSNDEEIVSLRKALLPVFRKYDIDLALAGHDHTYARAFIADARGLTIFMNHYAIIERESKRIIQLYAKACNDIVCYSSCQGILFLTANSSSGSKYYKLIEKQQDYIEAR
ncbi:metallophosphoesterase, partial [Anaerosporobacter sp.]|uniref:metallophosphoesterase n=1 Tax=Anaerosporobacter sp. TaxID=1872529 RepID=UPI00286F5837